MSDQKQQTTIAELREKNEVVINKHIAALTAVGNVLQQFLDVLTANALLTAERDALKAELDGLKGAGASDQVDVTLAA